MDSNIVEHAKNEFLILDKIGVNLEDGIKNNLILLLDEIVKQQHTGFSAPYCVGYFDILLQEAMYMDDVTIIKTPTKLYEYAKHRFTEWGYNLDDTPTSDDTDPSSNIHRNVLALIEIFSKFDPFLSSPHIVKLLNMFSLLVEYKPLSPITGRDDEWTDVSELTTTNEVLFQNNRLPSVFKKADNQSYCADAIVWDEKSQHVAFTGKVEDVTSFQKIQYPFTPKTFYIDIVKIGDEDKAEYKIKDRGQLAEVFEYYVNVDNIKCE